LQADDNPDVSKTWYPPLEKTLSCLSKLYRCLESEVFTGLAQVLRVSLLTIFNHPSPRPPNSFEPFINDLLLLFQSGSSGSLFNIDSGMASNILGSVLFFPSSIEEVYLNWRKRKQYKRMDDTESLNLIKKSKT